MASRSAAKTVLLERDCEALLVPHAHPLTLPQGTAVRITQALGGNYTCEVQGNLVLILAEDRDALGMEQYKDSEENALILDDSVALSEKCWHQLHQCYDPEIPVDIVDLGLVYDLNLTEVEDKPNQFLAYVTMTLTSPTCGMGPVIIEEVKRKLMLIEAIHQVTVELVFEPPWSRECMTEAARLQLGLM